MSDNSITITISADGLEAYAHAGSDHLPIAREAVEATLQQSGIVFGVLEEAVQTIVEGKLNGHPLLVAKGCPPVHGKDGWVQYFFDHERARPVEEKSGKVDLREMHYVHNIRQGDQLATIHPPGAGVSGTTVTGKTVSSKEGKKPIVRSGANTQFGPQDVHTLLAKSDGNVQLKADGTIEIQPALILGGSIDFSTGNIDFVGSLKVSGDVKSDFVVKVEKDLEVLGNIEDARIEVGGDVKVKRGFIGNGKGQIVAKGNVTIQHVLNQSIVCGKDIVIEKECVNGNLKAGGRIALLKGTIAGGHLEADLEVDVDTLGSGEYSQPRVRVGRKGRILDRLAQLEKDIPHAEKQHGDVKDGVYKLIRMKLDTGLLSPEKEQMLVKLQEAQKSLQARIQAQGEEKALLLEDLKKESTARIVVRGTVYENVLVDINGVKKVVDQALKGVVFLEHNGSIEIRSL